MERAAREMELRKEFGIDGSKTLTQIEDVDLGPPPPNESGVVTKAYNFRYIPVVDLLDEELRFMLLQQLSLATLVPAAIVWLRRDPIAGGNIGEGVLLRTVLEVAPSFYQAHPDLRTKVEALIPLAKEAATKAAERGECDLDDFENNIQRGLDTLALNVIHECLRAVVYGPFFDDNELSTLFGLTREEIKAIADKWPSVDMSSRTVRSAVINSLNWLVGYPHGHNDAWDEYISISPDAVDKILDKIVDDEEA